MSPHHFTKSTVSASFYCPTCNKDTEHRIDDGRRGPCLNPDHRKETAKEETPAQAEQLDLSPLPTLPRKDTGGRR